MSAGGGSATAVLGGIVNFSGASSAGAVEVVVSLDVRNFAGVSGVLGARLLVSLHAQSSPSPAVATIWRLTGGTKCVPDRRSDRRFRLNTDLG